MATATNHESGAPAVSNTRPSRPPQHFPLAHRDDLWRIDQPPPIDAKHRWSEIHGILSQGLARALQACPPTQRAASLRVVMLGKSNGDGARPCIVVFCLEMQRKRAIKFFGKSAAKELYQPFFDVHIGPPPKSSTGDGE